MPSAKKERSKKKKVSRRGKHPVSEEMTASAARIEAANAVPDLSTGLETFLAMDLSTGDDGSDKETTSVRLEIRDPTTLREGDAQGMYDLLKSNMHDMYMEAGWGWNKEEKWREMEHRHARFLMAWCGSDRDEERLRGGTDEKSCCSRTCRLEGPMDGDTASGKDGGEDPSGEAEAKRETAGEYQAREREGEPAASNGEGGKGKTRDGEERRETRLAGYCHFRFAWDEDENEDGEGVGGKEDVLYVYELQVATWATRRGLGRRMMQALELLANRHGMGKVMLTVFNKNAQAMSFYTNKMRYGVDKDSPSNWGQLDEVYEILSKPTRHGIARAKQGSPPRSSS